MNKSEITQEVLDTWKHDKINSLDVYTDDVKFIIKKSIELAIEKTSKAKDEEHFLSKEHALRNEKCFDCNKYHPIYCNDCVGKVRENVRQATAKEIWKDIDLIRKDEWHGELKEPEDYCWNCNLLRAKKESLGGTSGEEK